MSNEENKISSENKITTVEKTAKVKDPRRVELGKRLAKISREAKERKARQRESAKREYIDFKYIVGGVAIFAGFIGIYFAYKKDKREIREEKLEENKIIKKEEKQSPVKKITKRCNLDNL